VDITSDWHILFPKFFSEFSSKVIEAKEHDDISSWAYEFERLENDFSSEEERGVGDNHIV
jgi:hypothetical protein